MKVKNQLFEKLGGLRLGLLAVLFAGVLALGGTQTTRAAATVNYAYTATGWTVSHSTCFTDDRSGYQFPPSDYVGAVNPSAATISTGDSVTVRFDFSPALYIHSSATTNLLVAIRMTDPSYNTGGGAPIATTTFSFTGTNVQNATATRAGGGNSSQIGGLIEYDLDGLPSILIPDPSQEAVINSISVAFTAPGFGGSYPDFSNTPFIARLDVRADSACPDPGPVLATTASDAIAPSATPSQSPATNTNGWNNNDVTVTWNWADNAGGSGLDSANCTTLSISSGEGTLPLSATCKDNAGNTGSASYTVKVDKTAPGVSCGAADGTWHAGDVSITCTVSDTLSGLANAADANFSLMTSVASGTETSSAATGSRTVADMAGNTANAGPVGGNQIDKKAPSISISAPTAATYTLNQVVAANYSCSDGGSGMASCAGSVASGANLNTASVGAKTFTVNATDNAGNPSSQSVNYTVGYNFSGFFQPVDNLPTLNVVKAGSAVPVKFSLGGNFGLTIFAANAPSSQPVNCSSSDPLDAIEETVTAGGSSLSYDATTNQYTYVWKTDKAWAGTCRQLHVKLTDGTDHVADFKFSK